MNFDLRKKLAAYFTKNPNIEDSAIHNLADKWGVNKHALEEEIYGLLSSFFHEGKSRQGQHEYDKDQLKKGIKVEMEHTNCKLIAYKIAQDHLAEIPDYYDRLDKMEKEARADGGMEQFKEDLNWNMTRHRGRW
jgi:hypothetical protein